MASGGTNSNSNCATVVAFCDENPGGTLNDLVLANTLNNNNNYNGQIAPNYRAVSSISCDADSTGGPELGQLLRSGRANATQTAGFEFSANPQTLCTATAGSSGGTFLYNA